MEATSSSITNVGIKTAISAVISKIESIEAIKQEQEDALVEFIGGKDVLAVLPTGFGKSLTYQLAPLVIKTMHPDINPIVIIVSPLIALMDDQIKEASKLGIVAMKLGDVGSENDIQQGHCQLVFGSPEAWLLNDKWLNMLESPIYRERLKGIIVDEVHVAYKW